MAVDAGNGMHGSVGARWHVRPCATANEHASMWARHLWVRVHIDGACDGVTMRLGNADVHGMDCERELCAYGMATKDCCVLWSCFTIPSRNDHARGACHGFESDGAETAGNGAIWHRVMHYGWRLCLVSNMQLWVKNWLGWPQDGLSRLG
jgi:hypothetical protein